MDCSHKYYQPNGDHNERKYHDSNKNVCRYTMREHIFVNAVR